MWYTLCKHIIPTVLLSCMGMSVLPLNGMKRSHRHTQQKRVVKKRKTSHATSHTATEFVDTQELIAAISANDHQLVEKILHRGIHPDYRSNDNLTALHHAAAIGNESIIRLLINHGAQLNSLSSKYMTPLHHAIFFKQIGAANVLLACGADVNAIGNGKLTPLHCAASNNFLQGVKLLLQFGADASLRTIKNQYADELAKNDEIKKILVNAANNKRYFQQQPQLLSQALDTTDLLQALIQSDGEKLNRIISEKKINIDIPLYECQTPLMLAVQYCPIFMTKLLVNAGATVNAKQENNHWTALHYAADLGDMQLVTYLLENGADVNGCAQDNEETPADIAAKILPATAEEELNFLPDNHPKIQQLAHLKMAQYNRCFHILAILLANNAKIPKNVVGPKLQRLCKQCKDIDIFFDKHSQEEEDKFLQQIMTIIANQQTNSKDLQIITKIYLYRSTHKQPSLLCKLLFDPSPATSVEQRCAYMMENASSFGCSEHMKRYIASLKDPRSRANINTDIPLQSTLPAPINLFQK